MRKDIKIGIIVFMLAAVTGCGTLKTAEQPEKESAVILTVSLPEAEWSGYTEGLTALYQKTHSEIQSIEWNLVDRSMYSDLLNVSVASQDIPDIISVDYGDSLKLWEEQLIPLEESQYNQIFSEKALEKGKRNSHLYSVPIAVEARGIIYNKKLLRKAGIIQLPETKQEFQDLCQKLDKEEIKPIMNHYKETLLTTTSQLLWVQMGQEDREKSLNALADFLDLTLLYGNHNALTTDRDTARNYFFIERYAMLNNEGTWLVPVLRKSGADLEEQAVIGPIPLYEEADKNKLPIEVLTLSVTKSSQHPEEAQEFLTWLAASEEAREYLESKMGILSASGMKDEKTENLSQIAAQTKRAVLEGKVVYDPSVEIPEELKEKNGEIWGRYLTGELDREQAVAEVQSLWQNQ